MIYKTPSKQAGYVRVVFELPSCVWADRIFVTGSFNAWEHSTLPMRQDRDGVWRASLDLPAGYRYEFRYVVDGRWQTDYHADGCTGNQYGGHNSVLDLTSVVSLPLDERQSSQVPDGHVAKVPHLPAITQTPTPPLWSRTGSEMANLRSRVAAA